MADRPSVGDAVDAVAPSGASAFYGPLAAAMERIVGLAATALRAPFAFILLTGDDRRCFAAGPQMPDWTSHDTGALWRSGIVERIVGGTVEMRDVMAELSPEQRTAAAGLAIGSLLGVPLTSSSGEVIGIICAADPSPTLWNEDDAEMLRGFASAAVSDWELRRAVAEHEANEKRLQFDASHDALTGLANRAVLLKRLREALERPSPQARATSQQQWDGALDVPLEELVAVFFLDVNDFRSVNERFGHHIGDQLLATLGRRLQQSAGADAVVARLGGDEFAVLVEKLDAPDVAEEMAERFRAVLAQPTTVGGESVSLSVSVGIALSTTAVELAEHVLRGADLAMARAKRDARGETGSRPVVFDWTIAAEARSRRRLQDELRRAVQGDEFVLHYMPLISLETGQITGVEALLRWQHPTRGLLSPFDFLVVAEELDIINDVGRWVLRQACQQVAAWTATLPPGQILTIAVNLSARQFVSTEFLDDVGRSVSDVGLPPACLVLEVNERVVARDMARAMGVLTGLRSLGTRVHLDDFGSGNSPIGYLQRLPLDGVKIDHTLVNRMDRDDKALRLVRSVVGLAREFGLDVVAEGITSAGHLKVLQDIGCTHGQGPLFSQAVDAAGVTAMLQQRPW
ncbi:MAG TPA: EAL domain-containing protein [Gemmatimonadaceae bacterium]|nr:EAL domain-containing protein [Gemmatimonadaceae bacterium]